MKLQMDVIGFKDFNENLGRIAREMVGPQTGIADSLEKGAEVIVQEAQRNIRDKFDTSGDFPSRVETRRINQFRVDIVVEAVYAAVHEYGGTFDVTERQRAFFWAKWYETENSMWKALALSESYTIPPRPYLRPAADAKTKEAIERASRDLFVRIQKVVK